MPKPRKKIKHLEVSHDTNDYKQESSTEDFVGKFLVGVFTAIVTALISQAVSNQVNWLVVALAVIAALIVLAVYQRGKG
ncbi:hypothetical protein ANRL3_01152 [Anaerolineae bacterium]|nr:hypothetical protein ANRL3_01152 [Anaerolineae bacterium]